MIVEPHRHEGIFIARGKEDALVTKNLVPGESVYGEKRVSVEVCPSSCPTFQVHRLRAPVTRRARPHLARRYGFASPRGARYTATRGSYFRVAMRCATGALHP